MIIKNLLIARPKITIFFLIIFVLVCYLAFRLLTGAPSQTTPPDTTSTQAKLISTKPVRSLHWLDDNNLAYFYENSQGQRVLATLNGSNENLLVSNKDFLIFNVYWSKTNNLLVEKLNEPPNSFLYDRQAYSLKDLNAHYEGVSWSPEGNSFFSYVANNEGKRVGIYDVNSDNFTIIEKDIPDFSSSYWSPDNDYILLYKLNMLAFGNSELSLFNLKNYGVLAVSNKNPSLPSWSPFGDTVAFLDDGGLYSYNNNQITLLYQGEPGFLSYLWLSNDEILLFDANRKPATFQTISLNNQKTTQIFADFISLDSSQGIEMALSPNRKTLAIASLKNGLWFVIKKTGF